MSDEMTPKLFFWSSGPTRDLLLHRCLVKKVIDCSDARIMWAVKRAQLPYLSDLGIEGIAVEGERPEEEAFVAHCPDGYLPIGLDPASDKPASQVRWQDSVDEMQARFARHGIDIALTSNLEPCVQLPYRNVRVRNNAIFVECAQGRSSLDPDLEALASVFRRLSFYSVTKPAFKAHNVIDCSAFDLDILASVSNQCIGLIGAGGRGYVASLTASNRLKPRAYIPPDGSSEPVWGSYPSNPVVVVGDMDDAIGFLSGLERRHTVAITAPRHENWFELSKERSEAEEWRELTKARSEEKGAR